MPFLISVHCLNKTNLLSISFHLVKDNVYGSAKFKTHCKLLALLEMSLWFAEIGPSLESANTVSSAVCTWWNRIYALSVEWHEDVSFIYLFSLLIDKLNILSTTDIVSVSGH